ncbi:hypothetical protein H6F67_12285 [Microcoleus sp. FACHB-1515]|uniref:DUF7682 family zinc-binding protein n=1 Tax=Cyanophyceae TaxID=3028117 RepID=UPI001683EAC6|nr:hypothetical protein [Microcoleus sp. FACHB-1515]MBD2090632.1 hypothetical protein [Microcoleus sp. FACHB-1515]
MGRSRKHRKRFTCGHRGFGQWCHLCASNSCASIDRAAIGCASIESRLAEAIAAKSVRSFPIVRSPSQTKATAEKQAWKLSFATDSIDLRRLPRLIVLKARGILAALDEGGGYWQLRGRRLRGDRTIVRIPVSYRYRLLCRMEGDRLLPLKVLSHEDYNPLVRRKNRV